MENATKRCPDCSETLPLATFPRNRTKPDGFGNYCKPCHNVRGHASRNSHGGARRYHLRKRYGIEPEAVDRLVEVQGGVCAICSAQPPTHLDHDHATGRIRGVLCVACNNGIGLFKDDAEALRKAAAYLEV